MKWLRRPPPEPALASPAAAPDEAARLLQQAVAAERQRLYADLHDDIGAKLLTLIHSSPDPAHADLARVILQDLRDIVSRSQLGPCTLLQALGQIRDETEQRLDVAGATLDWVQAGDIPDPPLNEAQALHLFRIAREAVTNALRHGHARRIRMRSRVAGAALVFDVSDDGSGLRAEAEQGRGTASMEARANELGGAIDWTVGTLGGAKVVLEFPLPGQAAG